MSSHVIPIVLAVLLGMVLAAAFVATRRGDRGPSAPRATHLAEAPVLDAATAEQVMGEIRAGRMISAIKMLRDATGVGLRQAKELAEAAERDSSVLVARPAAQADSTQM